MGIVLGVLIWRKVTGHKRTALSVVAVLVSGIAATVASGEYADSWIYVLLDLSEAALGLALGFAIAHRFLPVGIKHEVGVHR